MRIDFRALLVLFACLLVLASGCARVERYRAAKVKTKSAFKPDKKDPETYLYWTEPTWPPALDTPLVFVSSDSPEWKQFKTQSFDHVLTPSIGVSLASPHPLELSVLATLAMDQPNPIQVKVPLGLPDPTPFIPANNRPTLQKWYLGKKLFYDTRWLTKSGEYSCATCHDPKTGFTTHDTPSPRTKNPPSLINVAYNKHQFWDGRVRTLEETLYRSFDDDPEQQTDTGLLAMGVERHNWKGFVIRLRKRFDYRKEYSEVFGVPHPTVHTTAQALATYMRTILSGDSVYDKAIAKANQSGLSAEDFQPFLNAEVLKRWGAVDFAPDVFAKRAARGRALFFSNRARCSQCHSGWNFTDGGFHNIGIRESAEKQKPGEENGRIRFAPMALKDASFVGAFRTPSLRSLLHTKPYFHDGSAETLENAVEYYSSSTFQKQINRHLDILLATFEKTPRPIDLTAGESLDIVLFLHMLEGEAVSNKILPKAFRAKTKK